MVEQTDSSPAGQGVAKVVSVHGAVNLGGAHGAPGGVLRPGMLLDNGAVVVTGPDGELVLEFADGHQETIGANREVDLSELADDDALMVESILDDAGLDTGPDPDDLPPTASGPEGASNDGSESAVFIESGTAGESGEAFVGTDALAREDDTGDEAQAPRELEIVFAGDAQDLPTTVIQNADKLFDNGELFGELDQFFANLQAPDGGDKANLQDLTAWLEDFEQTVEENGVELTQENVELIEQAASECDLDSLIQLGADIADQVFTPSETPASIEL